MASIPYLSGVTKKGVSYGIRVGTGAPASNVGFVGEIYIDKATLTFYGPKDENGWGAGYTSASGGISEGDLLAAILNIDGPGSNIDADTVDGMHAAALRDWANLLNVPSAFPPTVHNHPISGVDGLQTELDDKVSRNFSSWTPVTATGTGTAQVITLPRNGLTQNDILVTISGVTQDPSSYTVVGTNLTLTAPTGVGVVVRPYGFAAIQARTASVQFQVDGNGFDITAGVKGDITIPFDCQIVSWTIIADAIGNLTMDLWRTDFANAPGTSANSITGSSKPSLSSQSKSTSSVLTGWSPNILSGDIIRVNIDSASNIQRVTVSLTVTLT